MSTACLACGRVRRGAWWAVLAGVCVGTAAGADARAADAVVDAGPVVSDASFSHTVSSGRGWAGWGRRDALGQVSLIAVRGHGMPVRLPVRPLRRLDGLDVGAGPSGGAAVAYRGCRASVCGYYRFALPRGPEVRLRVPGPPRGCRQEHPVIARRLFVARWPRQARRGGCRAGIYELRGPRFVLRYAAVGVESVDVERGRLAVASFGRDEIVRIVVRRLRGGAAQLVARDDGALSDDPTSYQLSWAAGTLWMGLTESGSDGTFGHAMRVRWTPRPVCTSDPRTYQTEQVEVQWAFPAGRVLYTDGILPAPFALRERTDPPPRYVRALSPCGIRLRND